MAYLYTRSKGRISKPINGGTPKDLPRCLMANLGPQARQRPSKKGLKGRMAGNPGPTKVLNRPYPKAFLPGALK